MPAEKLLHADVFLSEILPGLAGLLGQLADEEVDLAVGGGEVEVLGGFALDVVDGASGLDDELVRMRLPGLPHCLHYFVKD